MMKNFMRFTFLLSGIEGIFVIYAILMTPSEQNSARLMGLSVARFSIVAVSLLLLLLFLGMFIYLVVQKSSAQRLQVAFEQKMENRGLLIVNIGICFLVIFGSCQYIFYQPVAAEPVVTALLARLKPVLVWGALICFKWLLVLLFGFFNLRNLSNVDRSFFLLSMGIFLCFVMAWVLTNLLGIGFGEETESNGIFRVPGHPILGIQMLGAYLVTIFCFYIWRRFQPKILTRHRFWENKKDLLFGLFLWILAFTIWMTDPLEPSWFADEPRPPNYIYSPNSDALVYDFVGQSLLVGGGFYHQEKGFAVRRPMLSAMIAFFHLVGGLGYEQMIWAQVMVVSLFPVLVYFVTKMYHNRMAAVLAAILIILRESNAILLADTITVSHAKLVMSDLPATLGMVLFVLLATRWMKSSDLNGTYPVLIGGLLGFFTLIRSEMAILYIFVVVISFWVFRNQWTLWFRNVVFGAISISLVITPWMWRNQEMRGYIYLDKNLQNSPILERIRDFFGGLDNQDNSALTNNSFFHHFPVKAKMILDADEAGDVEIIADHLVNGHMQLFLLFPQSPQMLVSLSETILGSKTDLWERCCSPEYYVRSLPYWWNSWDGKVAMQAIPNMVVTLLFISVGISAIWQRQGLCALFIIGLVSFFVSMFAVNKMSGGRWLLEVDWVYIMIFSVGLIEISQRIISWLRYESIPEKPQFSKRIRHRKPNQVDYIRTSLMVLIALAIGLVLPLCEQLIPSKYSQNDIDNLQITLVNPEISKLSQNEISQLRSVNVNPNTVWYGRALYPRFFEAGDGMEGKFDKYKLPFSRVEFYLVGTHTGWVVMPYVHSPDEFPHAADVFVVGCPTNDYFDVAAVVINPSPDASFQALLTRDTTQVGKLDCSIPSN